MASPASALLAPRSAWAGFLREGTHGASVSSPGVTLAPREGLALATIVARRGRIEALQRAMTALAGATLPGKPAYSRGRDADLVWAGLDQWLLIGRDRSIIGRLSAECAGLAAVTDQSDGKAIIRVSGPCSRDALAKGVMIDLHPRAFAAGDTALTAASHMAIHIWQTDDTPTYDIAVARSLAGSFARWLIASAAEYGLQVRPAIG